jgi:uncharacterized protein YecE (DUF72 family)
MNAFHIGCSSFQERRWKGIFYPEDLPQRRYFEYYATRFDTYEMNSSFYKFPTTARMAQWYEAAPDGFRFAVKAPRLLSHFRKMDNCAVELSDFYNAVTALKEKLSVVLFQFPGQFHYAPERLQRLVGCMSRNVRHAIEFRHESWWREDVLDTLRAHNIAFCGMSYPKLDESPVMTADFLYYRFHGNRRLFYSEYTNEELRDFAEKIKALDPTDAFVYFNNTASAAGVLNALELQQMLG